MLYNRDFSLQSVRIESTALEEFGSLPMTFARTDGSRQFQQRTDFMGFCLLKSHSRVAWIYL